LVQVDFKRHCADFRLSEICSTHIIPAVGFGNYHASTRGQFMGDFIAHGGYGGEYQKKGSITIMYYLAKISHPHAIACG